MEYRPMRPDELGKYVCVAHGGCLHSTHRTITADGVWVRSPDPDPLNPGSHLFSSAHRDCFEAWQARELAWYPAQSADEANPDIEVDLDALGNPGDASWATVTHEAAGTWTWHVYRRWLWDDIDADPANTLAEGGPVTHDEARAAVTEWVLKAREDLPVTCRYCGKVLYEFEGVLFARYPDPGCPAMVCKQSPAGPDPEHPLYPTHAVNQEK